MRELNHKNNFTYLCGSLLALLFSAAVVQEFPNTLGQDFLLLISILMLVVSIKSIKTGLAWKKIVYGLILLLVLETVLAKLFLCVWMPYLNLLTLLLFFMGSFIVAYRQILFVGVVDTNKIIGSVSLYLLLGLIWAMIYLLLLAMDATALSGIEIGSWQENFSQVAYYSFVTLTTLGYGDVLPASRLAEFFVYLEAVTGVFYMAIIVSSLISIRLASLQKEGR
jgi:hypothetical protein